MYPDQDRDRECDKMVRQVTFTGCCIIVFILFIIPLIMFVAGRKDYSNCSCLPINKTTVDCSKGLQEIYGTNVDCTNVVDDIPVVFVPDVELPCESTKDKAQNNNVKLNEEKNCLVKFEQKADNNITISDVWLVLPKSQVDNIIMMSVSGGVIGLFIIILVVYAIVRRHR